MSSNTRRPSSKALEKKAAHIAATMQADPTVDQLVALQGDLDLLNKYLQPPGCTVQQLITVFDGSIPADMVRAAMAGLELLAKDASATSEAAKSLTDPLDLLGRPLLFFVSTCASVKRTVDMPPDFLAPWGAAAAPALAYLQQHSQECPPTDTTRSVLTLVVALLRAWRVYVINELLTSPPVTAAAAAAAAAATTTPPSHAVTTMVIAADLCVLLVTSLAAAAAFPQQVQVSPGKGRVNYLHHAAATTLRIMASLLGAAASPFMSLENAVLLAAFVSDSVQRAMVLHLAACMPYCVEQMGKQHGNRSISSSGSGRRANSKGSAAAPPSLWAVEAGVAVAREQLQRLAFQRPQDIQQYGFSACDDSGVKSGGTYGNSAHGHLCAAYGGLQLAFVLRSQAICQPEWPERYRGAITCPPTAVAIEAINPLVAPVVAPGIDPLLLHELLLRLLIVLGPSAVTGINSGLGIIFNSLQPATPRSADKARVATCLQLLWLGLGPELQRAAGVKGDQLDADAFNFGPEGHMGGRSDGSVVEPATAASDMLKQYGYLLIQAFIWQKGFLISAEEIFVQQPQLACRVLEAAVRTFTWPAWFIPEPIDASDIARHFKGLCLAAAACTPASLKLAARDRSRPQLMLRCFSLMVSVLKQVQQQLTVAAGGRMLSGWHAQVLPQLLAVAGLVAGQGMDVSQASVTEGQGQYDPQGGSSSVGPGGVSTAWLALSGRGMAEVGCVLACPAAVLWLLDCMRSGDSSVCMAALQQLASLYKAVKWVAEQLAMQQQQSCAGPAADAASLRKLQEQAAALFTQWQPLHDACAVALDSTSSRQAQVAALSAFGAACGAGGWLPAGLQELGEGVWSAFPQRYTCGYPACANLQALTEYSTAKFSCPDCKPEGVRYCCKEHQVRHWPQHKKACRAIKQALAADSV